jgi:hypothetical protein
VVAAKSFVAAAFFGLLFTATALGDAPTVRFTNADQAKAQAALLKRVDLGAGWAGGPIKASALTAPDCPGFSPKESDLTVTGHADALFTFKEAGVELDQDVEVLSSDDAVMKDFARTISPQLGRCIGYQLGKTANVLDVSVARVAFPKTGAVSAVYRAELSVRTPKGQGKLLSDYVFFGEGRVEYEFTVIAPVGARYQLGRFELGLAKILLRRAGGS